LELESSEVKEDIVWWEERGGESGRMRGGEGGERRSKGEVRAISNDSNGARASVEFELMIKLEIGRDVPTERDKS
jgi:hypothetical protein